MLHREDGPAVIYTDVAWHNHSQIQQTCCWYQDGVLHRLDGPAVEDNLGKVDYYINGRYVTKEDFEQHPEVNKATIMKLL